MERFAVRVRAQRTGGVCALACLVLLTASTIIPWRAVAQSASITGEAAARARSHRVNPKWTSTQRPAPSGNGVLQVQPACDGECKFSHVSGKPYAASSAGAVATPIGTTYSVHHMVGADLEGTGTVECRFIFDTTIPPPGAPDDTVSFDGIEEAIMTDVRGTVPSVTEDKTDNADRTHLLVIDTSSASGTDLFPAGINDPGTGTELVDACFVFGIPDPLDWPGMDTVTAASISYLVDGTVVHGPFDVSASEFFTDPWPGFFGATLAGGAGQGINGVHMEIVVEKVPEGPLAACCAEGQCLGDIEEASCAFQGGDWNVDASCGADRSLPTPICDQAECSFNNGLPLDDRGGPLIQFAPDFPYSAAAVDDFILEAPGDNACHIQQILAWVTHSEAGIDPNTAYQGVNVTIYSNAEPKGPNGQPEDDGSHTPTVPGGIVYTQTLPMSAVTATSQSARCALGIWQLDLPVDMSLNKNTKYWLEVQPIMDASVGEVYWLLSQNVYDHPAQQIAAVSAINEWEDVPGNQNACPSDAPPTPQAGSRTHLAFQLFGDKAIEPSNDACELATPVGDGVIPISTVGAHTDGPDEPGVCDSNDYTQVGSDIWFDHVASCAGNVTVSLCGSDYDTKLAVYAGCVRCPPPDIPLVCNDDFCGYQSSVTFSAAEGSCYRIRVGGYSAQQGKGVMTITCEIPPPPIGACCDRTIGRCINNVEEAGCDGAGEDWNEGISCGALEPPCVPPAPPHDECDACIPVVTGVPYNGTTIGSTGTDVTQGCGALLDTKDVWHCWTADCTGAAVVSLCGSSSGFDTTLAVYDACGGNELGCNDDRGDRCSHWRHSEISPDDPIVSVTAGETYYIRVSGWHDDTGSYTLEVKTCQNACCTPDGSFCGNRDAGVCENGGGILHPGKICMGDGDGSGIDDTCEQVIDTWFWKDYNGDEPGGLLPDYDQNKDYDNVDADGDPTTGVDPFYCGPAAVADSLWWFHHKYPDAGVVPDQFTKIDLIEHLAVRMGTNGTPEHPSPNGHRGPYAGTFVDDLRSGINDYLAETRLTTAFYEHTENQPPYEFVADELMLGQDITLLLGLYHVEGVDPVGEPPTGYVVRWRRVGGHYVALAGVDTLSGQLAISDPDADAAEEGAGGFVRGGDHNHDADNDPVTTSPFRCPCRDHIKHNDKDLASHDVYDAMPSSAPPPDNSSIPGGTWILGVGGDPLAYGEAMALFHADDAGGSFDTAPTFVSVDFLEQKGYPQPVVCQTYTVVEKAVIISPYAARLDINKDGFIDYADWSTFVACYSGPDVHDPPLDCLVGQFQNADFEGDGDVDMEDARLFLLYFAP